MRNSAALSEIILGYVEAFQFVAMKMASILRCSGEAFKRRALFSQSEKETLGSVIFSSLGT
jgi:hypothetical protein